MINILASIPFGPPGGFRGKGPLGLEGRSSTQAPDILNSVITTTVGVMTVVAGIWFIILFVTGAIQWISAGGDKGQLEEARKKIIQGAIGLAIVVASVFLIDLIGKILGFGAILDPGSLIRNLTP